MYICIRNDLEQMSLVVVLLWFRAVFANSLYTRYLEFYFDCGLFYVVRRFHM